MADELRCRLQRVGLDQLADTLTANDVDLELLLDLSDEDLKELGLSLGHRRRLRAIGELPRGILEDAHWLDPTTREMVTRTLSVIGDAPVMMLITHRPDFETDWTRHPQVTALTLSRLSRQRGMAVVQAAGGGALPDATIRRILQRAEGVPLFIEELTRSANARVGPDRRPRRAGGTRRVRYLCRTRLRHADGRAGLAQRNRRLSR